ncbi:cytochrome P450 [Auriculariales sp. MPI-PUGE-AT-0066]|nr:cytochrome P450 [Auriculariales sp. MPI-PUGE-AT-0066]
MTSNALFSTVTAFLSPILRGCVVAIGLFGTAVILNIASQCLLPRDPKLPPEIWNWIPFVGSAIEYGMDPIGFVQRYRSQYGDCFTFVMFGRRVTVCAGVKGTNMVLSGSLASLSAEDAYKHLTTPLFGKGVVYDCPNTDLVQQKRFLRSGLTHSNFAAYVGQMEDEVSSLLTNDPSFVAFRSQDPSQWGEFHSVEGAELITTLTSLRTLHGSDIRNGIDADFTRRYLDLAHGFCAINFICPGLPLPLNFRRDRAQKELSDYYVNIIRSRQSTEPTDKHSSDMIASLIGQRYKDGRELSEREVAHLMISLLLAGQHNSSATLAWALLRIANDQSVANELYREQLEWFGNPDGSLRDVTYDELKKLPILDAVIRETLRLHPPIHSIMRKVVSDIPVPATVAASTQVGKEFVIPAGHYVLVAPAVSQVDPAIWSDPLKWNPRRWSEHATAQHHALYYTGGPQVDFGFGLVSQGTESPYQPFGAGRHRCVGEPFAYLQIGMVITSLVRKMEMRLSNPFPENNYRTMIVTPKEPCTIQYRRRT